MKTVKYLNTLLCIAALLAGASLVGAADDTTKKKDACCEATVDAGKTCKHKCCNKAAEKGKVCKRCHPDAAKAAPATPAK